MTLPDWKTVADSFVSSAIAHLPREHHDYLVAYTFPDTQQGQMNASRMVEYICSVNGPGAAFGVKTQPDVLGDIAFMVAVNPTDICCAQAQWCLRVIRDTGWLEREDYLHSMLPQIHEHWGRMTTVERIGLADLSDLPMACVLDELCPEGLQLEVQAMFDS